MTDQTTTVDPTATKSPLPDEAVEDRPATGAETRRAAMERVLGVGLVVASLLFALFVQTALFERWSSSLGDLLYHRGVAYTVAGGDWQGEGPYRGLISYSGGLYPMLFGGGARLFDLRFDTVLSVVSWFVTLAFPLAALLLARRVWPNDWLSIGVFVALMTAAGPLSTATGDLWTDSVLPSGHNFSPAYPRDFALTTLFVGLWAALSTRRRTRVLGAGVTLAVTALFQAQIGALGALVIAAWWFWLACRSRKWRQPAVDVLATTAMVGVLTSWWWIPRVVAVIRSRGLRLPIHPAREVVAIGPRDFVIGFGIAGLIGVVGVLLVWRRRFEPVGIFLVWLVLMVVPLLALTMARNSGFVTSRRTLLLASVPLLGLAVPVIVGAMRALPRALAPVIVVAILAPSAPAMAATFGEVRHLPWSPGVFAGGDDVSAWTRVWDGLRHKAQRQGNLLVLTYDSVGMATWSFSGARVYSTFFPGVVKPGFDIERLTGVGYRERVRRLDAAFASGSDGLCRLGRAARADAFALDAKEGLVGVYDQTPAAQYRTDPRDRTSASINRTVAPGVRYRDTSGNDYLEVAAGGRVPLAWHGADIRLLRIDVQGNLQPGPAFTVRAGGDMTTVDAGRSTIALPAGASDGLEIMAVQPLVLRHVTGYAAVPGLARTDGPFVISRDGLCRGV